MMILCQNLGFLNRKFHILNRTNKIYLETFPIFLSNFDKDSILFWYAISGSINIYCVLLLSVWRQNNDHKLKCVSCLQRWLKMVINGQYSRLNMCHLRRIPHKIEWIIFVVIGNGAIVDFKMEQLFDTISKSDDDGIKTNQREVFFVIARGWIL